MEWPNIDKRENPPQLVLDLLPDLIQVVRRDLLLQVLRERLRRARQVPLVRLKDLAVVVLVEVVGKDVRDHQCHPALLQGVHGAEEVHGVDAVLAQLDHLLHLLAHGVVQLALKLAGLGLGLVALVVEQVLLQPRLGDLPGLLAGVVLVAAREAVPPPRVQAYPAEGVAAGGLPAGHVVAAAVLLDGVVALGALLRVGVDPVERLGVVLALLGPLPQHRAADRTVPRLAAGEAVAVPAGALGGASINHVSTRR